MTPASRDREWRVPGDHLVVYASLLLWWFVGPALFDDGWMSASVENFQPDGDYGSYYATFNTGQPLGWVHFTVLRWISTVSGDLVWLRVPAVAAGLASWHVSRAVVDRVLRRSGRVPSLGVHLILAAAVALGWISYNMSLRQEPLVALLAVCGLWSAVRFAESPHGRFLLIGAGLAVMGISMHPAGLVTLAPWWVLVGPVARWVRVSPLAHGVALGVVAVVSAAALVLLVWGPQGYRGWASAVDMAAASGRHSFGWRAEYRHYTDLYLYGNAIRRLAVMLPAMGLVLFLGRRDRRRDPMTSLVMWTAFVGLLLLGFTPSKWLWHFGAVMPLAAVALAMAWVVWREVPVERRSRTGSLVVLGILIAVNVVGWYGGPELHWEGRAPYGPFYWVPFLAHALDASDRFRTVLGVLAHPGFWVGLVVAVGGVAVVRNRVGRRPMPGVASWLHATTSWLLAVSLAVALAVPIAAFTVDGLVLTRGWSLAKQNLEAVFGSTCGLAEEMLVAGDDGSMRPLDGVVEAGESVLIVPQLRMYFPCLNLPAISNGVLEIPTLVICGAEPGTAGCSGSYPIALEDSSHRGLVDVAKLSPVLVGWGRRTNPSGISITVVGDRSQ